MPESGPARSWTTRGQRPERWHDWLSAGSERQNDGQLRRFVRTGINTYTQMWNRPANGI